VRKASRHGKNLAFLLVQPEATAVFKQGQAMVGLWRGSLTMGRMDEGEQE
jgi:hypothetical protein